MLLSFSFVAFLVLAVSEFASVQILSCSHKKIGISNVKLGKRGIIFSCVHIFRRYVISFFLPYTYFLFFLVFFFCRCTKLLHRKKKSAPYWIVLFAECQQKMFCENVEINFRGSEVVLSSLITSEL